MVLGGFSGKGFLQGTQSYLDFLPEKHTDFIFTLFSEEFGFIGSIGLLLLYLIIIIRIIRIGVISRSSFAKLFCFGFAFSIFIYITVNLIYGVRFTTYSRVATANNVIWWFFYVSNNDWFWYCIERKGS